MTEQATSTPAPGKMIPIDIEQNGKGHVLREFVRVVKGWVTYKDEAGAERKIRIKHVALDAEDEAPEEILEELLTDEVEDEEEAEAGSRGDVFPPGKREKYKKGTKSNGKAFIDSNDYLAQMLRDESIEEVAERAAQLLGVRDAAGWLAFYTTDRELEGKAPLNPGMVRMNLGNRIRAEIRRQSEEAGTFEFPGAPAAPVEFQTPANDDDMELEDDGLGPDDEPEEAEEEELEEEEEE
jgi:hypothetical protein